MKSICVYCGSSPGNHPKFVELARLTGRLLAERGIRLVYGGGNVGLMGACADAVLSAGGEVVGVIPEHLMNKELGHRGVTELHIVKDMHERKALMIALADGFISLPGSIGTFEETFETMTWSQLGLHPKPCGILNLDGYYDPLIALLENSVNNGFMRKEHLGLLYVDTEIASLIDRLHAHIPVTVDKWLDRVKDEDRVQSVL